MHLIETLIMLIYVVFFFKKFKEYKRLTKFKRRKFKEYLTTMLNDAIEKDPQNAWKIIDELKRESTPTDKAEKINHQAWFDHFNTLLNTQFNPVDKTRQNLVKNELNHYETLNQSSNLDYTIIEKEVFAASKKLKNNKASAYDLLKNEMIKSALPFLSKPITKAFNMILNTGKFPKSWKSGIIIPVHKNGSQFDPNNYRGITLSSCLGKLFCHIINNRICSDLENRAFLKQEQAGFRKNHRTSDHIFVLRTIIDKYVLNAKKGSKLYACFIDLRKAFDTVWHDGLLLKLQKAGINGKIYKVIKSMYSSSQSRVKSKHTMSEHIEITQGVHQGRVLSPVLFNIFINDIGEDLLENNVPILNGHKISHLLYADDLLLLSTSENELQRNITIINEFCNKWGLSVNADKSKVMVFSKSGRMSKDQYIFTIGHAVLENVNQYKYLGVHISANGKFMTAEKNLSLKASRALFSIKQSIFDSNIKPSAVLRIFHSLIKPITIYNSEIWAGYKTCYHKKSIDEMFEMSFKGHNEFDKIFTRFSKYVLGVHSKASNFAVLSELGQLPLIVSIIASCINFWLHTIQSNSESLISAAYWEQCNNPELKSLWLCFIKTVLNDLGFSHVWDNHCTFNVSALLASIKTKLKERFISYWKKNLNSEVGMDKLRTYKLFKRKFEFEIYLDILPDRKQQKALTAFRISAHHLKIERGRYSGQRLEDRLCNICNVLEDEIHFFCDCSKYTDLRNKMFQNMAVLNSHSFESKKEQFIKLMASTDDTILKSIGLFVSKCNIS